MAQVRFGRARGETQGSKVASGSRCGRKREVKSQRTSRWPPEFQLHIVPSAILKRTFDYYPGGLSSTGDTAATSNNPSPPVRTSNTIRTLTYDTVHRMVRSRSPNFPTFIDDDCFIRVQTYMVSTDYNGPVALGCDDTKLHPSLQVYWDDSISQHILIGTTFQRKIVAENPEELRELLAKYKDSVATKVRGIPTHIL